MSALSKFYSYILLTNVPSIKTSSLPRLLLISEKEPAKAWYSHEATIIFNIILDFYCRNFLFFFFSPCTSKAFLCLVQITKKEEKKETSVKA